MHVNYKLTIRHYKLAVKGIGKNNPKDFTSRPLQGQL